MARPLHEIAADIRRDWRPVNYAARPYLAALAFLDTPDDSLGADSARSIVAYFLANASTWRGETARAVKAELRAAIR